MVNRVELRQPPADGSGRAVGSAPLPPPSRAAAGALYLLALLDAVGWPGVAFYWVTTWPDRGGLLGTVVGALLVWWAIKRTRKALVAIDTYRWTSWRLLKLAAFGYLLLAVSGVLSGIRWQDGTATSPTPRAAASARPHT